MIPRLRPLLSSLFGVAAVLFLLCFVHEVVPAKAITYGLLMGGCLYISNKLRRLD